MTQPQSSDRYPAVFSEALSRVMLTGEFVIPCSNQSSMRAKFFGYLKALRVEGKAELADSVEILAPKDMPTRIILRSRDNSPEAREVEAALMAARGKA